MKDEILISHINAVKEDFDRLEKFRDSDRAARANVTFCPYANVKDALAFFKERKEKRGKQVIQFPEILSKA